MSTSTIDDLVAKAQPVAPTHTKRGKPALPRPKARLAVSRAYLRLAPKQPLDKKGVKGVTVAALFANDDKFSVWQRSNSVGDAAGGNPFHENPDARGLGMKRVGKFFVVDDVNAGLCARCLRADGWSDDQIAELAGFDSVVEFESWAKTLPVRPADETPAIDAADQDDGDGDQDDADQSDPYYRDELVDAE